MFYNYLPLLYCEVANLLMGFGATPRRVAPWQGDLYNNFSALLSNHRGNFPKIGYLGYRLSDPSITGYML